jgi:uncharacterized DUF497 family protein
LEFIDHRFGIQETMKAHISAMFIVLVQRVGYNFFWRDNVTNWSRFAPADFEYDFENDKLSAHRITFYEAIECFFFDFEIRRNKSYKDRYQLIGKTAEGRTLKIIFQLKPGNIARIITGWPL